MLGFLTFLDQINKWSISYFQYPARLKGVAPGKDFEEIYQKEGFLLKYTP